MNIYNNQLKFVSGYMGGCAGSSTQKKNIQLDQYWKQPKDTRQYESLQLRQRPFQGLISHIRIKNSPYFSLSLKVNITGVDPFSAKLKKSKDGSFAWSLQHMFAFQKTLYQLRKSFLKIQFLDERKQCIGTLQVNLFLIATGPSHHDFLIRMNQGQKLRISFDMKISQIVEIHLESIQNELTLKTQYPDERFSFSIKTIVGHSQMEANSRKSYLIKVLVDGDKKSGKQLTDQPQKSVAAGSNIVWSKNVSQVMPSIGMSALASKINQSYFEIMIWKFNKNATDFRQLFGECYISLHKMFGTDPQQIESNGIVMEQRFIQTTQKLWDKGREIGKAELKFRIRNEKYIRQMQLMIRTEQGVKAYTPVTFRVGANKSGQSKRLMKIIQLIGKISKETEKLQQIESKQNHFSFQSRKIKVQIEAMLEELLDLLSDKQNIYSCQRELMKAQETFIQLGFKIVYYLQEQDTLITELCWKVMIALLQRSQFILNHIGFTDSQISHIQSESNDHFVQAKIEVGLNFQKLLNKQLQLSLKSISFRGLEIEQRFSELFLAYAYFLLPLFRNRLLDSLVRQDDFEVQEWRGTQFSLHKENSLNEIESGLDTFKLMFDWQNRFHKCIENKQRAIENLIEIEQILDLKNWKQQMKKRSTSFFFFIIYWVEYIESKVIRSKDVSWQYFPGYNKIIKYFLIEMKKRPIIHYPDALKSACLALLSNEKLLNSIISIIIRKANLYEPLTLLNSIQFISTIFSHLSKTGRRIHASFNYYQLYRAIKIILQGDFSFAVSKTLLLLYNHYKMFHMEFRRNISMLLMGPVFFKLFLHWSHNVRDIFCHLFIIRIYRQSLFLDHNFSSNVRAYQEKVNQEIRKRYEELLRIIQNAYSLREEARKKAMPGFYENNMVKNLRKKLEQKKKKKVKLNESFDDSSSQEDLQFVPSYTPTTKKHADIYSDQYSVETLLSHTLKLQRTQSEIRILKKDLPKIPDMQTKAPQRLNSIFLNNIYDRTEGTQASLHHTDELINKYEERDFQIPKLINASEVQYLDSAIRNLRAIKEKIRNHRHDKDWNVPHIRMEMPLDTRQSKPDKIENW